MKALRSCLLLGCAAPIILFLLFAFGMPVYDRYIRHNVMKMVAAELPPHASMGQMKEFLNRHAAKGRYAFDGEFNNEWAGLLPQSVLDQVIFDRQVGIELHVDPRTRTFRSANVQVYYTFL